MSHLLCFMIRNKFSRIKIITIITGDYHQVPVNKGLKTKIKLL